MTGYVYAIESGDHVKLGYSINPESRLETIKTGCPAPCRLLGFIEATQQQERELHQILKASRVHGEWFVRCAGVEAFISMLPPMDAFELEWIGTSFVPRRRGRRSEKVRTEVQEFPAQ